MGLSTTERELLQVMAHLIAPDSKPVPASCPPPLTELLRRHHLRPLANAAGMEGLTTATHECAAIAAFHRRTLEQVGSALQDDDIPWTTIKGAAYAWTLYDAPELRPMSDIDILVRDIDFTRAQHTLSRIGLCERSVSVRTRHAQTYFRASHEIVDLHRNILQPMRGNTGIRRAWERARSDDSLPGYWRLAVEDLCWIHVAHMARHEFVVPLVAYLDLKRLLLALPEESTLANELSRMRLHYSMEVAMVILQALREGSMPSQSLRMRIVMPTLEELLRMRHRNRGEQVLKKLALFPRDTLALGVGWALRSAEDRLIRDRSK